MDDASSIGEDTKKIGTVKFDVGRYMYIVFVGCGYQICLASWRPPELGGADTGMQRDGSLRRGGIVEASWWVVL
jgi:hypothetical protein